jgi:hypothetical protein
VDTCTKKLRVSVTQDHINSASRSNCEYCPIALAIKQLDIDDVIVHNTRVYLGRRCVLLPKTAQHFVSTYDRLGPNAVTPFKVKYDPS